MKRPEDMTDQELIDFVSSPDQSSQTTQQNINKASMKRPEDMTDQELMSFVYGDSKPTEKNEKIDIINEAADIPWQDRLLVKNFGGSVEDQVSFLQKKNPHLEIRAKDGDIIAKYKNENKWKKLDPSWSLNPQELIQDTTDMGYDIGSGVLTGLAGAFGAVPGALAGGGVGGIPTAMATSGAASAGLEAIKQMIGTATGTRKDISKGEIALSGILGGATTGLFGGGASKSLINKAVENPNIVTSQLKKIMEVIPDEMSDSAKKSFAKKIIEENQKGLISKKIGSNALSLLSGIDVHAIDKANSIAPKALVEAFGDILDQSKKYTFMEISDIAEREGAGDIGKKAIEEFVTSAKEYKETLQNKLGQIIDSSSETIDINSYREPLENLIEKLKTQIANEKGGGLKSTHELLDEARKAAGLFGLNKDALNPNDYMRFGPRTGDSFEVSAKSFYDLKNSINDRLDFNSSFVSLDNKPIKSKMIQNMLKDLDKKMGKRLDDIIFKASPDQNIRKDYAKLKNFQRVLAPKFKNEETALRTISNSKTLANKVVRKNIEDFSKDISGNTVLLDLADLANVNKVFGDAPLEAISSGGATSTGKFLRGGTMGMGAGYLAGLATGIPGAANTGAMLGGGLGALATSPAAIKNILKLESSLSKSGKAVLNQMRASDIKKALLKLNEKYSSDEFKKAQEYLNPQMAAQSAWQLMKGE